MPTTPNGLPYPAPGDVPDGAAQIKALADELDGRVPKAFAAGAVNVTATNSVTGTAAVTLPAGRFTGTPVVTATTAGTSSWVVMLVNPTANGFTLQIRQVDATATTATVPVHWHAAN